MTSKNILTGKKILVVDDEPDVLATLIELLDMCKLDTAASFEEGKRLLEDQNYDLAILDIMGVRGFDLLKIANHQKIPALMLTANALSEESLKKSAQDGAAYFAPKDKMADIELFVADVLTALKMKKSTWEKWFDRLSKFYDGRFHGTGWREQEKKFWASKIKTKF
ncbi:response regulator [Desulfobacula sp.]|uniref:response regulator n=1 Tax=Desulfobacula sp. TaxID=2593537 RepID=UPI00260FB252|nr:response regulator [Desulfobacula sp.]